MSVLKLAPNFAQKSEVLYKLAVIFGKTYQLDHAINYFKMATLESSGAPAINRRIDILIKMTICYVEKKEYTDALRSSEAALAMNDQNYRALQHVAWCEFLLERYPQALKHIDKAISLKQSDGDGYYIKGRILMATEKYPDASESFKNAIRHNHSKVAYLGSSGILNALTKSYNEAFNDFLKATQIDDTVHEIWFNIGILYEMHQQYSEALLAYKRTIEADPSFNEAILRKQALSSESPTKSPPPQFVHPEFRVYDPMVPMKSYLNNQKVKKAIEPCLNPEFSVQPSSLIKNIFNSIDRVPAELPLENAIPGEEIKNSDKLPNHQVEEVKKEVPEEKKVGCLLKTETLPERESKPKPLPKQSIRAISIPEPNYAEHQYYMPPLYPMGNAMPQVQPKQPMEVPAPQYNASNLQSQIPFPNLQPPLPTTVPNNTYPSLPGFSLQQLELLSQLAQLQQQNPLQALLNSIALLSQPTNPYLQLLYSYMQPSTPSTMHPPKPSYTQPPFSGNLMRPVQQMPSNEVQFNQYSMPRPPNIPMYNPVLVIHKPDNPSMSYEQPQYSQELPLVSKPVETDYSTTVIPTRPVPQHPRPIKPIPRTVPIEKTSGRLEDLIKVAASGDDKVAPLKNNPQGEEEKLNDPNTMVKLNMYSNKVEENHMGKRRRPEADANKEVTPERERHNTRRHKT
jgi:tetratricopeptide (TPR) repeat protein